MKRGYSIIVLKDAEQDRPKEVRRFNVRTLAGAKTMFKHHADHLKWSRQHKESLGLNPKEHGRVWLYDHDCKYELEEELF
jgi:hypothetical protein